MPEPRETHAAIDARRNAQRGGGEREALAEVLHRHGYSHQYRCECGEPLPSGGLSLAQHQANVVLAAGWLPERVAMEGAVAAGEAVRVECNRRIDALAATVQRVRELAHQWEARAYKARMFGKVGDVRKDNLTLGSLATNESCARELRAALDAAPSDPATDTGGEG